MEKEKIVYKKVNELKLNAKNPRKNDNAVDAVAKSIEEFGFKNPLIIDKNNVVWCGNTRLKASRKLGIDEVPCIVIEDLTEEQIRKYALLDNKTNEIAEWDFELLQDELMELDLSDFGLDWGIPELEEEKEPEEDDFDVDANIPEEPKAKYGDIYQLGNHRLMCGDSIKVEDVEKLMNGAKADMVFTDPPYGMNLDTDFSGMIPSEELQKEKNLKQGKKYKKVIGDNEDFKDELVTTIFNNFDYCKEIFVWGADYYPELLKNYKLGNFIIWDKKSNEEVEESNFDKTYPSGFEVCWSKNKHKKEIVRCLWVSCFGTEQEFDHQRVHPTQKPTKLSRWFIDKYSKENDLIVDIYGGSGSTLIACEQLNRKCYMMELDPKYVDVIIKRWEDFTGKKAIKIN